MGRNFHPDEVAAAYDYLCGTLPFKRWKLPESDYFAIHVTEHTDRFGHFDDKNDRGIWVIGVSTTHTKTYGQLLSTIAHEMVHIRLKRMGFKDWAQHGYRFRRLAMQVCRWHGLPLEGF